jgi:hypothetical protein
MKKLIIATLLVVGMTSFAQEIKWKEDSMGWKWKNSPPEQQKLMLKNDLKLDLSAKQQNK